MSIKERAWRERGRALYAVPDSAEPTLVLTLADAREVVSRRLRASLHGLPERQHDAAIDAAARGFVQAHRACGLYVRTMEEADPEPPLRPAVCPSGPPHELPERLLAELGVPRVTAARPQPAQPTPPVAVSFTITQHHVLTRGLGGGRVRIPRGESAVGAVVRRISRDTRCEVVGVVEEPESDGAGRHFRVTLRGSDGRGQGCRVIEGAIQVKI